jgi:hypothetical protein
MIANRFLQNLHACMYLARWEVWTYRYGYFLPGGLYTYILKKRDNLNILDLHTYGSRLIILGTYILIRFFEQIISGLDEFVTD